jgi:hypothetical protein
MCFAHWHPARRRHASVQIGIKSFKARLAPSSVMVFVSNPFEPDTLFIKCILALYLIGQLKLFHIYPVNMVNSKKEYPENAARC